MNEAIQTGTWCDVLADRLALQPSGDGNFFGDIRNHPVILKPSQVDPNTCYIKIRHGAIGDDVEIDTNTSPWKTDDVITFSWDSEDYIWIDIDDMSALSDPIEKVIERLDEAIAFLHAHALQVDPACMVCATEINTEVAYSDERAAWICPACFEEKIEESTRVPADRRHPLRILYAVLGVILTASAWALVWSMYHWVFRLLEVRTIYLPTFVLIVVFGAMSLIAAWPVTHFVAKSPTIALWPDKLAMPLLSVLGVLAGELLSLTILVRIEAGFWSIGYVLEFLGEMLATYSWTYGLLKIATLCIIVVICTASAKKRGSLDI